MSSELHSNVISKTSAQNRARNESRSQFRISNRTYILNMNWKFEFQSDCKSKPRQTLNSNKFKPQIFLEHATTFEPQVDLYNAKKFELPMHRERAMNFEPKHDLPAVSTSLSSSTSTYNLTSISTAISISNHRHKTRHLDTMRCKLTLIATRLGQ